MSPLNNGVSAVAGNSLADLVEQLTARLQAGEDIDSAAVVAAHPEYADRLSGLLPALRAVAALGNSGDSSGDDPLPNAELGDFRIVRQVGRGGMGVVYEAEQLSLRRRVALKVLPFAATMDPRQLQRFRNEALAAASLHHEHIVPVHAVGCERGVHYYAMQFIDGHTLADMITARPVGGKPNPPAPFPKREGGEETGPEISPPFPKREGGAGGLGSSPTKPIAALSTRTDLASGRAAFRQAAEWIAQAAEALEYAHSLGVIHRDVKPGNLMVDAAGKLWVADFGLARFGPDAGLTMSGALLGTLRYMAPEQAMARHGLADHRVDVYGLGCTLYELLTGKPAVRGEDKADILRHIAFQEPVAPRKLDKTIPAELETIALKCLAKNPVERYATAGELAADLRRWLNDKPIKARRPTVGQRLGRWARRHPGLTGALGLVAGLLCAGGWAWNRETTHAETAARAVAAEADQLRDGDRLPEALVVARRAADLLPRFGGGADLRRAITERVADMRLLNALEKARLEQVATRSDGNRFDLQQAAPWFRQAFLDYGVDVLGGDDKATIEALRRPSIAGQVAAALGEWERCTPETQQKVRLGQLADDLDPDPRKLVLRMRQATVSKDAEALKRLAAEAENDLPPPAIMSRLGNALEAVRSFAEAERLLRAGQRRYPADFWITHSLACLLEGMGPTFTAESIRFHSAALALRPLSAGAWLFLSGALEDSGQFAEAEAAIRRAIELKHDFSTAHYALGRNQLKRKQYAEAEASFRRALETEPDGGLIYGGLGSALIEQGKHTEAEAAYRRAIELDPKNSLNYSNLCNALRLQGRFPDAEAASRRAIELNPGCSVAHNALGCVLLHRHRDTDAEAALRQSIALDPKRPESQYDLGICLKEQFRLAEAETAIRRSIELDSVDAEFHNGLGVVLVEQHRYPEAEVAYRRAIELKPRAGYLHHNLGEVLNKLGRYTEAMAAVRRAIDLKCDNVRAQNELRAAEQLAALEPRLPAILSGDIKPADAAEYWSFSRMCRHKKLYAAEVRLCAAAFAIDPKLAAEAQNTYDAACAAVLAAAGEGSDADKLDDAERARLRRQALDWLTTRLAGKAKLAETAAERQRVGQGMHLWQTNPDFASVRDADELAKLPAAERVPWEKYWADVAALRKRAEEPPAPEKPPPKP